MRMTPGPDVPAPPTARDVLWTVARLVPSILERIVTVVRAGLEDTTRNRATPFLTTGDVTSKLLSTVERLTKSFVERFGECRIHL